MTRKYVRIQVIFSFVWPAIQYDVAREYVRIQSPVEATLELNPVRCDPWVRVPLWILHRVACTKLAQAFTFCSLSRSGCISKLMLMPFGMNRPNKIRRRFTSWRRKPFAPRFLALPAVLPLRRIGWEQKRIPYLISDTGFFFFTFYSPCHALI